MAKQKYEYIGEAYPGAGLYPGDVRKVSVKKELDGGVNVRVWGSSDQRKVNLFYRNEDKFKAKWREA